MIDISFINPFHATGLFRYSLKTSKNQNQRFSDVFRGYRKRPVAWNVLMFCTTINEILLRYLSKNLHFFTSSEYLLKHHLTPGTFAYIFFNNIWLITTVINTDRFFSFYVTIPYPISRSSEIYYANICKHLKSEERNFLTFQLPSCQIPVQIQK